MRQTETRTWNFPADTPAPPELVELVGGSQLAARLLVRRGLSDPRAARAFLNPEEYPFASPYDLPDLPAAVERIRRALDLGERIWVWGDFDVDGQTSTALLVEALRELGADPRWHIPVRAVESHGVNRAWLERILAEGADLLITCDTGVTAHDALAYAQENGLDVIVTDHHALAADLPPALAVITPRRLPPAHPMGGLPGVGTAFKLVEALFAAAGRAGEEIGLLDLVALGIVADVALQTGDTRALLQRGLAVLRRAGRTGLCVLMENAGVSPRFVTEEHIGFALAPRLNALGRLDDANSSVELFTTRDEDRARLLAAGLETLNARRQLLTSQVLDSALKRLEREPALLNAPVLVLEHPEWPAGVIGIVASQLVERFGRPVILLASPPGQSARGSARSVAGLDITAAIAAQADLLLGFGGHPMAAGLSLPAENLPEFRRRLAQSVAQAGLPERPPVEVDAVLNLADVNLDLADAFERLAPFGPGNPAPLLAVRGLALESVAQIGRGGEHLALTLTDRSGEQRRAVWWDGAGWPRPEGAFDLLARLRASNVRGQREAQLEWVDFRPLEEGATAALPFEVEDLRGRPHPLALLEARRAAADARVWAEGDAVERVQGSGRAALAPCRTLLIWTTPPGAGVLRAALERTRPERVVLLGIDPPPGEEDWLRRLAGLARYLLQSGDRVPLEKLAAALAEREETVRAGLEWMAARGKFSLEDSREGIRLAAPLGENPARAESAFAALRAARAESAAYRSFFQSAAPGNLF